MLNISCACRLQRNPAEHQMGNKRVSQIVGSDSGLISLQRLPAFTVDLQHFYQVRSLACLDPRTADGDSRPLAVSADKERAPGLASAGFEFIPVVHLSRSASRSRVSRP